MIHGSKKNGVKGRDSAIPDIMVRWSFFRRRSRIRTILDSEKIRTEKEGSYLNDLPRVLGNDTNMEAAAPRSRSIIESLDPWFHLID